MTRTPIPNFKLFFEIKIMIGVIFILKLLIVFKTMSGFPFLKIVLLVLELISPEIENQTLYFISICFVLIYVLDYMFCMFSYIYVDNGDVINICVSLLSDFPKDLIYILCGISQDRIVRLPSLNALHKKRMIIRFRTFISLSLQSK